jgi:lysophospholipase
MDRSSRPIDVAWEKLLQVQSLTAFQIFTNMNENVACLPLYPSITAATITLILSPPISGLVLESYGAGNAPTSRADILIALKQAADRGVVIVNCTQCARGSVSDIYETGKLLNAAGITPG